MKIGLCYLCEETTLDFRNLNVGTNHVLLNFDGMTIYRHGADGPYNLSYIALYDENGTIADYRSYAYTTSPYNYTQFYGGGAITGTVTDYNGDPVPDAHIYAIGLITASTITNINGTYNITRLQSGSYTIRVEPLNPNLMTASDYVYLTTGEIIVRNYTLQAAGSIAGNITDVNGTGIPNIIVYLSGYETPRYRTDENGYYVIPRLQAGTYTVNVDGSETDFEDNSTTVVVMLGKTTIADFVLNEFQGGSIAGRVTDMNGTGVSNAHVVASGPSYEDGYTNETGYYAIQRLLVGNYTVTAYPPYGSNLVSNSTTASVTIDEITIVNIILPEGGIIAGRVTYENGTGIYDARVSASGPSYNSAYTNDTGYYSIVGLLEGNYTVTAYPPYGTNLVSNSTTATVILGETTVVDFVLHPPPDIWIYPGYFNVTLPQGNVTNKTLIIGNNGTGVLEFGIADDALIITDPNESTLVDIKNVYVGVSPTHVTFRMETYTSMAEAWGWGYMWLDTDQDSATGAKADIYPGYGLNDIGADYCVIIDLYVEYASLYRWTGDDFEFVSYLPLNRNSYYFTFSTSLSDIADDGIMDITLMMRDYSGGIDIAPDERHGTTVVGADWLSESPASGTVDPDNQIDITITINAVDLEVGEYSASIIINSNDPDGGIVNIPVLLRVSIPTCNISLATGWNMITLPFQPANLSASSVLPTIPNAGGIAYVWNNSRGQYDAFLEAMELELGRAYWIAIASAGTWTPSGSEVHGTEVNLTSGWNMIGILSCANVSVLDINITVGTDTYNLVDAVNNGSIGGVYSTHGTLRMENMKQP